MRILYIVYWIILIGPYAWSQDHCSSTTAFDGIIILPLIQATSAHESVEVNVVNYLAHNYMAYFVDRNTFENHVNVSVGELVREHSVVIYDGSMKNGCRRLFELAEVPIFYSNGFIGEALRDVAPVMTDGDLKYIVLPLEFDGVAGNDDTVNMVSSEGVRNRGEYILYLFNRRASTVSVTGDMLLRELKGFRRDDVFENKGW